MATLNYAFKELSCKIVYYGCGLCGKTTNLIHIHKTVPGKFRGELVSLATEQDRTLFFDFLPLDLGEVKGFKTKFQLYTVPGQVYYNATRKLVLRGVDGLVFVADSQRDRFQENIDSLENLKQNLQEYGSHLWTGPDDIEGIPWLIQYNKRDMPHVASIEELQKALNPMGTPHLEAVAVTGVGVKDTLKGISSLVIKKLNSETGPAALPTAEKKTVAASPASAAAAKKAADDDEYGEISESELEAEVAQDPKAKAKPAAPAPAPKPEPKPAAPAAAPKQEAKPAPAPAKQEPPKPEPKKDGPPQLNVVQNCGATVRGMGLGSANLTLANLVGGDKDQYQLTGKVTFLAIFGSTWSRKLRYKGQESRQYDGAAAQFFAFEAADGAQPQLEVMVKDDFEKSLFVNYIGSFGEVKISPAGKKSLG